MNKSFPAASNKKETDVASDVLQDSANKRDILDTKPSEDSDEELVAVCQSSKSSAGDKERAYSLLLRRNQTMIFAMLMQVLRNRNDASDVAQTAFVKAWRAIATFRSQCAFSSWLYRIARNCAMDFLRKKKRLSESSYDEWMGGEAVVESDKASFAANVNWRKTPSSGRTPSELLEGKQLAEKIQSAMRLLTPAHREIVAMRDIQGMSYKCIAQLLDCTMGTVMSRLFYARKNLQIHLREFYNG